MASILVVSVVSVVVGVSVLSVVVVVELLLLQSGVYSSQYQKSVIVAEPVVVLSIKAHLGSCKARDFDPQFVPCDSL